MEVKVCKNCRGIFNDVKGDCFCPKCKETMGRTFQKVTQYIKEHDDASMAQVSANCNVSMSQIETWIKEEKIHTIDEQDVYSTCGSCNKPIASGNYCNLCKRQLIGGLKSAFDSDRAGRIAPTPHKNNQTQMRFISSKNN